MEKQLDSLARAMEIEWSIVVLLKSQRAGGPFMSLQENLS
jgi:hypothetical protein